MDEDLTVAEVLIRAKELISDPKRWCKKRFYITIEDFEGNVVHARHCAIGAVRKVMAQERPDTSPLYGEALEALWNALPPSGEEKNFSADSYLEWVVSYNDLKTTTHQDIMDLFDRAIQQIGEQ